MPSRKGKGRQSLGFGRKSQRAQFHQEWQARLQEDYYQQKRKQQQQRRREESSKIRISQQPPRVQSSLRRLIAERQYWDRLEDRSWIYGGQQQQQKRLAAADPAAQQSAAPQNTSPPGWLLYHTSLSSDEAEDCFAIDYLIPTTDEGGGAEGKFPTLQSLALQALAKALPDYLEELGVEQLHNYLSLLPGPALSVLSVLTCQCGNMTNNLCRVLGQHSQLTRFSLVACAKCEETDPNWKDLQPNIALRQTLLPKQQHHVSTLSLDGGGGSDSGAAATVQQPLWVSTHAVPDSWEDLADDDDDDTQQHPQQYPYNNPYPMMPSCCQLERLELGNLPLLQVEVVKDVLLACGHQSLTHLGLSGSLLYYDRGPDVLWQLSQWVPNLQVLDVSGNSSWVTEPVLRSVYESYQALWESKRSSSSGSGRRRRSTGVVVPMVEDDEAAEEDASVGTATTASVMTRSTSSSRSSNQQPPHLLIKATGCLTRSSQILMEMEFGTLF